MPSIAHSAINVLTALSVLNEGVREVLPFVRYISTFIDTEFNMIKQQDHGKGVVCAATWSVGFVRLNSTCSLIDKPHSGSFPLPSYRARGTLLLRRSSRSILHQLRAP